MQKSRAFLVIAGVFLVVGVPSFIAWQNADQVSVEERLRILEEERKAAELQAEQLAQELEDQSQEAAQVREWEEFVARTAGTWQRVTTVLENAESIMTNNSSEPLHAIEYVATEMESVPIHQIDPELAAFVQDLRRVSYELYQLSSTYNSQLEELGVNVAEASRIGCNIARDSVEENKAGWCLGTGLLSGAISFAAAREEVKELEADYNARLEPLVHQFGELSTRFDSLSQYLLEEYGISTPE